jgi:hypothetical protein
LFPVEFSIGASARAQCAECQIFLHDPFMILRRMIDILRQVEMLIKGLDR